MGYLLVFSTAFSQRVIIYLNLSAKVLDIITIKLKNLKYLIVSFMQ